MKLKLCKWHREIAELILIKRKGTWDRELYTMCLFYTQRYDWLFISHDLRTPLTSIHGYLTLLKDCENKEEQEHYFSVIQAKADYLTELLQIFYDLSLIKSDEYILEIEKLDINRIVTDCLVDKYNERKELTPIIKVEESSCMDKRKLCCMQKND